MSEYQILAVVSCFIFLYSVIASRLEKTKFNGPLIYVLCGFLLGPSCLDWVSLAVDGASLKMLAELTLAVVLFTDAAGANIGVLRRIRQLPTRLLLIGLPMTLVLGYLAGELIYRDLPWFEVALLATILAPTDAALGQAVVANERVPSGVREGLKVESGLNDGICVPVLLFFLAFAAGPVDEASVATKIIQLPLEAIGIGLLVGLVLSFVGSLVINLSIRIGWMRQNWIQLPVLALSMVCFAVAQELGGSGFIACFMGGLLFGQLIRQQKEELLDSAESTGDLLSMITWFVFGAMFIDDCLQNPDWRPVVFALLSLTVIRMLPVFLCVSGLGLHTDSKLFMGWFGPRGLASIVFIVMVREQNVPGAETLSQAVVWTILLSVVLHGVTANPLAKVYGQRIKARDGQV